MIAPLFADISAYQGVIDWKAYHNWAKQWTGTSMVSMKSSEGIGFTDPRFVANRTGALSAGVDAIIYYHYGRPDLGNAPNLEADWQRSVVGTTRQQDTLMLDYEQQSPAATAGWALSWLERQATNYGKLPIIYASTSFVQAHLQDSRLAKYPLVLANWTYSENSRPPCPPPWSKYLYLQYTDKATNVPGIAGAIDMNVYLGPITPPAPPPVPPPVDMFPQEALDCWNSVFNQFKALAKALSIALPANFVFAPPTGTGIYHAWTDAWSKGHHFGPPLTFEYNSSKKDGSKIVCQEFARARCEWGSDVPRRS